MLLPRSLRHSLLPPPRRSSSFLSIASSTTSSKLPCHGEQEFNLGLPAQSFFPILAFNYYTRAFSGYLVDLFDEIKLETRAQIHLIPLPNHLLADAFDEGLINGFIALSSVNPDLPADGQSLLEYHSINEPNLASFTSDVFSTQLTTLLKKTNRKSNMFAFLEPFSEGLWLMILACVLGTGFVMAVSEFAFPYLEGARVSITSVKLMKLWYHSAALLQAQDDFEWITPPMKVLRLGVMFSAIIFTGSYTANLVGPAAHASSTPSSSLGWLGLEGIEMVGHMVRVGIREGTP